jgi:hypothetical protein
MPSPSLTGVTCTLPGDPGTVAGVTDVDEADGALGPTRLLATTVKV